MNYQKVYMNQIHSSSLLCQLAQMWRSQLVCDAYIRTGNVTTKAHRVVLLAACPMLQSMERASIGSHLEVRLTADIKQESVNMFLQYLYEGFMLLTEDNCKEVEKVARLLQVDSVIKCCADFYKCLEAKTGGNAYSASKYKFNSYDLLEFRHVRATDLQKTVQDRLMKRASEMGRPSSPSNKKQRLYRSATPPTELSQSSISQRADDTFSMSHSYSSGQQDNWERVPRVGANAMSRNQGQRFQQPSVIDIVEDSIELVHVDPGDGTSYQPPSQKGVAVSVASQIDSGPPNISIVNVTGSGGPPPGSGHSQQRHQAGPSYSSPHQSSSHSSRQPSSSGTQQTKSSDRSVISLSDQSSNQDHSASSSIRPPQLQLAPGHTPPHEGTQRPAQFPFTERLQQTAGKPFAAGSARQAGPQMPGLHSGPSSTGSLSNMRPDRSPSLSGRSDSMDRPPSVEASKESSKSRNEDSSTASSDLMTDLTIIKVETGDVVPTKDQPGMSTDTGQTGDPTGGLDMHVDAPDDGGTMTMQIHRNDQTGHEIDSDIEELETTGDWTHDDNDESSMSNDPNNPLGGFRGSNTVTEPQTTRNLMEQGEKAVLTKTDSEEKTVLSKLDSESSYQQAEAKKEPYRIPDITKPPPSLRERATIRPTGIPLTRPPLPPVNLLSNPQSKPFSTPKALLPTPVIPVAVNPGFQSSSAPVPKIIPAAVESGDQLPEIIIPPGRKRSTHTPAPLTGADDLPGHKIVPIGIKNGKRCVYCQINGIKTPSGWRVKTNYKCLTCDVGLCSCENTDRNCFILYHKAMFGDKIAEGK